MPLAPCNPVAVPCVGLSFQRVPVAVNALRDPEPPIISAPQLGLMCQYSEVWGAAESLSARG